MQIWISRCRGEYVMRMQIRSQHNNKICQEIKNHQWIAQKLHYNCITSSLVILYKYLFVHDLCYLYMASFIFQQNYIVLGAHLLSLWCSNQCLHTDHGRYLHCHHTLLLIANQVTNHCWIRNKQNLLWCHMVLDHQLNKTKHVSIWKFLRHRMR